MRAGEAFLFLYRLSLLITAIHRLAAYRNNNSHSSFQQFYLYVVPHIIFTSEEPEHL
jgi:hypothetical protein